LRFLRLAGTPRRFAVLAAAAILALAAVVRASGPAAAPEPLAPLPVTEVAPGVFVHGGVHEDVSPENHGDIANIGFIVGTGGVAVIDTGNTLALGARLRGAVGAETDLPIRYVINTHVHPDHIFGNAAFREDGPDFVGHKRLTAAMAEKAPYYVEALSMFMGPESTKGIRVIPPTVTVAVGESIELDLGGRTLTVTGYPTAHTDNDVTVVDSQTATLWAGDLVFVERIPSLDGSLKGWIRVMEDLKTVEAARVIPGHGPVSGAWPAAMEAETRYFRRLLADVRGAIEEGRSIEYAVDAAAREERGNWLLFDDYHPRNVTASYLELEWE
jgi:quinoprotein relay system zinc metallohydrolase 2